MKRKRKLKRLVHRLEFAWADPAEKGGYSFPCDHKGEVLLDQMSVESQLAYWRCQWRRYPVVDPVVRSYEDYGNGDLRNVADGSLLYAPDQAR